MQFHKYNPIALLFCAATPIPSFQPYTFDQYDPDYVSALRGQLDSFHERLNDGDIPTSTYASDVHWNFDGNLAISDVEWDKAVKQFVGPGGLFSNYGIRDHYQLVDGNICGTLFNVQGNQSGDFLGLPVQPGARFRVYGAELWVFDENLEASELITIQPTGKIRAQFAGEEKAPPRVSNEAQPVPNEQTSLAYRHKTRQAMISMHKNVLAGQAQANSHLALEDVVVDNVGDIRRGRDAFVEVIAAQQQGKGSFPGKQFHDEYIIIDGRLGMMEYIWHGRQKEEYMGRAPDEKMVRVRGMLWFEFDKNGLVEKVVSVHDEAVIMAQLEGTARYLYP